MSMPQPTRTDPKTPREREKKPRRQETPIEDPQPSRKPEIELPRKDDKTREDVTEEEWNRTPRR